MEKTDAVVDHRGREMLGERALSMSPNPYSAHVKKQMRYSSRTTGERGKGES